MTRMIQHSAKQQSIYMDMNISVGEHKKQPVKHPLMLRDLVCLADDGSESALFDVFVSLTEQDKTNDKYRIRVSTTLGIGTLTMYIQCAYGEISVLDLRGTVMEQNVAILTDVLLAHKQQLIHWLQA